jgi:hypothetical protein
LRKEHRLRVLRRIVVPKRDEVTGQWRNEELNDLYPQYCSGGKIENEIGRACCMYGGEERRILGFGGEI